MNVIQSPYALDDPLYRPWWLAWRREHVCSTDTVALAGCGYEKSGGPVSKYLDKLGLVPETEPTEEQSTGSFLEPHIAKLCEQRFGVHFVGSQVLVEHPTKPHIAASLDLVDSDGTIWEIKSIGNPKEMMGLDIDGGDPESLPARVLVQNHHQMIAAEEQGIPVDKVITACLVGNRIGKFVVHRNPELADALTLLIDEFWDRVIARLPPDDFRPGDAAIIQRAFRSGDGYCYLGGELVDTATEYSSIGPQITSLEKRKDTLKAKLLLALGNTRTGELSDGRSVVKSVCEIEEEKPRKYTRTTVSVKKARS